MTKGNEQAREDDPERPMGWWSRFLLSANTFPCIALTVLLMGLIFWLFASPAYSMTAMAYPAWFFLSIVASLSIFWAREIQVSFSESLARRLDLEADERPDRMTFRFWSLLTCLPGFPSDQKKSAKQSKGNKPSHRPEVVGLGIDPDDSIRFLETVVPHGEMPNGQIACAWQVFDFAAHGPVRLWAFSLIFPYKAL